MTRIIIFVPLGRWSDVRSIKEPIIACQVVGIVGQMLYVMASVCGTWALPMLIASRVLVGVAGASATPATAYIARAVPRIEQVTNSQRVRPTHPHMRTPPLGTSTASGVLHSRIRYTSATHPLHTALPRADAGPV